MPTEAEIETEMPTEAELETEMPTEIEMGDANLVTNPLTDPLLDLEIRDVTTIGEETEDTPMIEDWTKRDSA